MPLYSEYVVFNLALRKYWTGRRWSKLRRFAMKFPYQHDAHDFAASVKSGSKIRVERVG